MDGIWSLVGQYLRFPFEGTTLGWGGRPPDPVFGELLERARIPSSLIVHMNRKAIVRVLAEPVMMLPALPGRIDVDRDASEMGHVMEQVVAHLSRDLMTLSDRQTPCHRDAQFGVQPMTDPPSPNVGHLFHAGNMGRGVRNGLQGVGIYAVQHPDQHGPRGLPDKDEDRRRDEEASYRVGQRVSRPYPRRTDEHSKAAPPIDSRVVAVGDQRHATDLPPDPNTEYRHGLIAHETSHGGQHHGPQQDHGLGMDEALNGLITSNHGAEQNRRHDHQAGKILDPTKTIGEAASHSASRQHEGDAERNGRGGIPEVMDHVGKQSHATREDDDHCLEERRRHQADEGPLQRPHAPLRRRDRGINYTVSMAMPLRAQVGMVVKVVVSMVMRMIWVQRLSPCLIILRLHRRES
jgi:hypothetical protein